MENNYIVGNVEPLESPILKDSQGISKEVLDMTDMNEQIDETEIDNILSKIADGEAEITDVKALLKGLCKIIYNMRHDIREYFNNKGCDYIS